MSSQYYVQEIEVDLDELANRFVLLKASFLMTT